MRRSLVIPTLIGLVLAGGCGGGDSSGPTVTIPVPVISAVVPARGTIGTEVRIDGSSFSSNVEVHFDGIKSPRVLAGNGALFAVAPVGLVAGHQYQVHVLNQGVQADSSSFVFTAVAPAVTRVNGVTQPTGLRGMTLIVEGSAFSDSVGLSQAQVFFRAADGSAIRATVVDTAHDWADGFVVTTVPQAIGDTSFIWVQTPTGTSDSVEFRIIQSGVFSPSLINWTTTTALPQPLQGLGAVFVPIEHGPAPANYVFALGGVGSSGTPVSTVYHAAVSQNGALSANWIAGPPLVEARGYHAAVAATPFTAPIDTTITAAFLYVIGGIDPAGHASPSVGYARVGLDGSPGAWQPTTPLPVSLSSPGAVVFAGYVYVTGGGDGQGMAQRASYRARINEDGSLGPWQASALLPGPAAEGALVSFGPYLYSIGGETGATNPVAASLSGSETAQVYFARIDLRSRDISPAGWSVTSAMNKARSKHGAVFAGGSIFVTSGVYAGQPGSSENTYAGVLSDGALQSWQGATGSETIDAVLGISLYNESVVTFIDQHGVGHVLVLGGADRANPGHPSAGVVRY